MKNAGVHNLNCCNQDLSKYGRHDFLASSSLIHCRNVISKFRSSQFVLFYITHYFGELVANMYDIRKWSCCGSNRDKNFCRNPDYIIIYRKIISKFSIDVYFCVLKFSFRKKKSRESVWYFFFFSFFFRKCVIYAEMRLYSRNHRLSHRSRVCEMSRN